MGKYIKYHEHIQCQCKIDNYIWNPCPADLLQGKGCPKCALRINGQKLRLSNEDFVKNFSKVESDLTLLEEYKKQTEKILVKCNRCGYEWLMLPRNILKGRSCPKCKHSTGERKIEKFLDQKHITYETQKTFENCKHIFLLRYDFYLPNYNVCIEFDGEQHFSPKEVFGGEEAFLKTQYRDNIKNEYCEQNNIKLLRIPYWDIDNIDNILTDFLFKK